MNDINHPVSAAIITKKELARLHNEAQDKGYRLTVEPCGECCDEPVVRITNIGGFDAVEARQFVKAAPDLYSMLNDPNSP